MKKFKHINTLKEYGIDKNGNVINFRNGKVLKSSIDRYGYLKIQLSVNGKKFYKTIHRLVAETYIENTENKKTVNHKDGVKMNNSSNNLEWATVKENTDHAYDSGLSSLNVNVVVTDLKNKNKNNFRSIQLLSNYLDVDEKHLLSYIKHSKKYPFMDRYVIELVDEESLINNLNSKKHGKKMFIFDLVNNVKHEFNSIGVASYYTGLRSMNKLSSKFLLHLGYMVSSNSNMIKPDKKYNTSQIEYNRVLYLKRPYVKRYKKIILKDMLSNDMHCFNNRKELNDFILKNHNINVNDVVISNIKLNGKNNRLFLGYGLQMYNNKKDILEWSRFSLEEVLNSRKFKRLNSPVYKVIILDTEKIIFTKHNLLEHLKSYIKDKSIFYKNISKITIECVLNSLDNKNIKIIRLNKIMI